MNIGKMRILDRENTWKDTQRIFLIYLETIRYLGVVKM